MEFKPFPKMARLNRGVVVTEKIDGTNAQVFIHELGSEDENYNQDRVAAKVGKLLLYAGSRNRWITPYDDNYGFAAWVRRNAHELADLGPGQHFGEWWGVGIGRNYGISERRFSLFNVSRWRDGAMNLDGTPSVRPSVCRVVPVLYEGILNTDAVRHCAARLRSFGSVAEPGFAKPEGVVVYHYAGSVGFKVTLEKDESPKSLAKGN